MTGYLTELLDKDPLKRRPRVLSLAAALFVAAVALRFAMPDPRDPVLLFIVIPIALLAIEFGLPGGLAAAAAAAVAVGAWSVVADVTLSPLAFASKLSAFFLVGLLVGYLFERLQMVRAAQRRLLESAPGAVVGVGLDGRVRSVNSRTLALFDRRQEDMVGREVDQFLPGFFSRLEEQVLYGGADDVAIHVLGEDKTGHRFPVDVSVSAWQSEDGALLLALER
jgi:PAS domain S-box-containing protein